MGDHTSPVTFYLERSQRCKVQVGEGDTCNACRAQLVSGPAAVTHVSDAPEMHERGYVRMDIGQCSCVAPFLAVLYRLDQDELLGMPTANQLLAGQLGLPEFSSETRFLLRVEPCTLARIQRYEVRFCEFLFPLLAFDDVDVALCDVLVPMRPIL